MPFPRPAAIWRGDICGVAEQTQICWYLHLSQQLGRQVVGVPTDAPPRCSWLLGTTLCPPGSSYDPVGWNMLQQTVCNLSAPNPKIDTCKEDHLQLMAQPVHYYFPAELVKVFHLSNACHFRYNNFYKYKNLSPFLLMVIDQIISSSNNAIFKFTIFKKLCNHCGFINSHWWQ